MQNPHELLPYAYRAASSVTRSPILAEEAGERALHLLTLSLLDGSPPQHPRAWLRVVARRKASALLRSDWARTLAVAPNELPDRPAMREIPRSFGSQFVREQVAPVLTARQREALSAALTCRTTRSAARSCGMPPRDFRRSLGAICRKAREVLAETGKEALFGGDAESGLHPHP